MNWRSRLKLLSIITSTALALSSVSCGKKTSTRPGDNLGKGTPCKQQARLLKTIVEINVAVSFGQDDTGRFVQYLESALSEKPIDQVSCRVEAIASTPEETSGFYFSYNPSDDKFFVLGNNDETFEFARIEGEPGTISGSWQMNDLMKHGEDEAVSLQSVFSFSGDNFTHQLTCQKAVSACNQ